MTTAKRMYQMLSEKVSKSESKSKCISQVKEIDDSEFILRYVLSDKTDKNSLVNQIMKLIRSLKPFSLTRIASKAILDDGGYVSFSLMWFIFDVSSSSGIVNGNTGGIDSQNFFACNNLVQNQKKVASLNENSFHFS